MGTQQMLCISPAVFNGNTAACGQCTNCRINHKLRWMGRMALEAKYGHPGIPGAFITLTYDDDHLESQSLIRKHLTQFVDELKRRVGPKERYFAVGEYGSQTFRPHYHVIHFGGWGNPEWQKIYKACWRRGHIQVGQAHPASQNYVAGYVTKKLDKLHHSHIEDTGLVPEFFSCSLKPTLGYTGLTAIARMLNTDQGAAALAATGFPRGYNLGGRYYPFFRRDRMKVAELAGYGKTTDEWLEDVKKRSDFYIEEMEIYAQAESMQWPPHRLEMELKKLSEEQHGEAIEKEIERARLKATKWRRRNQQKAAKPLDNNTSVH